MAEKQQEIKALNLEVKELEREVARVKEDNYQMRMRAELSGISIEQI